MATRIYSFLVVGFWLASMSWLVVTKVLPPLRGGQPPDYSVSLPPQAEKTAPICWRISWKDQRIGTAVSQVVRHPDGGTLTRHMVHFDRLPLEGMIAEGFGAFSPLLKPVLGTDRDLEWEMQLATELQFTKEGQFTGFYSTLDVGTWPDFLHVNGTVQEDQKLRLTSRVLSGQQAKQAPKITHVIDLPARAIVRDAFAPPPVIQNLRVGQTWTIPVYQPFPPNSPVQIVEAVAERLDVILHEAKDVETILVVYREEAGSGLHASREPIAREWVRMDGTGTVLQREVRFGALKMMFTRMTTVANDPEVQKLDPELHPRLWKE